LGWISNDWEVIKLEGYKIVGGIGLVIVIAVFSGYIIMNGESIFKNTGYIKYSDDCIENYTNGELVGEECVLGRGLEKEREKQLIKMQTGRGLPEEITQLKWNNQTNRLE